MTPGSIRHLTFVGLLLAVAILAGCGGQANQPPAQPSLAATELPAAPSQPPTATATALPSPAATPTPTLAQPTKPAAEPVAAPAQPARSTPTPEPLVPTLGPSPTAGPAVTPAAGPLPTATPTRASSSSVLSQPTATPPPPLVSDGPRSRLGLGVPRGVASFDAAAAEGLGLGWYLDWGLLEQPVQAGALEFAQIVLFRAKDYWPVRLRIAEIARQNPGSLWFLGNEPDVPWQDNQTPEAYAQLYHDFYLLIKSLDPTARVAIGGVSQPTPLRMLYLERVLAAYQARYGQAMPVDIWNVHAFVLREERDSWGVSIPPGFEEIDQGRLYEIEDHDDLALFRQQIIDFRRWMARHGQRDKPLIVSEYGILMPEGYGFPPESVAEFMTASFDFLLNARDAEIGYPADANRLVQRLAWYSFSDTVYPTSNLVDPVSGELTAVGAAFAEYAATLPESYSSP